MNYWLLGIGIGLLLIAAVLLYLAHKRGGKKNVWRVLMGIALVTGALSYDLDPGEIGTVVEADGTELYDLDNDGDMDFIVARSSQGGGVYWLENVDGRGENWTTYFAVGGLLNNVQMTCAGDFDEDGTSEIITSDNSLYILEMNDTTPQESNWTKYRLTLDDLSQQSCRVWDMDEDGDLDFIYTYEGGTLNTGGLVWFEYLGGEPSDNSSWTRHDVVIHEGAWGTCTGFEFVDADKDGEVDDFWYTSRAGHTNSNPDPGTFYASANLSNLSQTWTVTRVHEFSYPLHLTCGDLDGDEYTDVIAAKNGGNIYQYDSSDDYTPVQILSTNAPNVQLWEIGNYNDYPELFATSLGSNWYLWSYNGSTWTSQWSESGAYSKSDDDIFGYDIDLDGYEELMLASQDSDKVYRVQSDAYNSITISIDAETNEQNVSIRRGIGFTVDGLEGNISWEDANWTS